MIRTMTLLAAFAPDGTMAVDEPEGHSVLQTGSSTYRRVAALVKPVRRWAGGKVPCEGAPPFVRGDRKNAAVRIRWEPEGAEVEVPVTCHEGPAADEIELVRAAIDETRTVAHDAPQASDMARNSMVESVQNED